VAEFVRFHFDPACPWAYQGSKWIREAAKVRDIEVEWRFFSLTLINARGEDLHATAHDEGLRALRSLVLVRQEAGNHGVGRAYAEIGARAHERDERLDAATLSEALADCGFDPRLVDEAMHEESTIASVRAEHDSAVTEFGAFGVPTIALPSGKAMFGPVVALAPTGEAAGELWDHVRPLIEWDGLFELKRNRDRDAGER
jgi:2-hydroxychromene-2-carboxylate isomerase